MLYMEFHSQFIGLGGNESKAWTPASLDKHTARCAWKEYLDMSSV